jgi:tetratricopeptide (TPR) repeat protein
VAAGTCAAQGQHRLAELAEVAAARAEQASKPALEALEPLLRDFALDHDADNREFLEKRIAEAAELGDSVVPALLAKLTPVDDGQPAHNVADNAARVLDRLDLSGFVDGLLAVAQSDNRSAFRRAVGLLGRTESARAGEFLTGVVAEKKNESATLISALHSLLQLRYAAARAAATPLLHHTDKDVRRACLQYLSAVAGGEAADEVIATLAEEREDELLADYVEFFRNSTPAAPRAAEALLPFLSSNSLSQSQLVQIVEALATVAPPGHEPTLKRLEALLKGGEIYRLGRTAAATMEALGDREARKLLFDLLDAAVKKSPRAPLVLSNRGDAFMTFGRWSDAVKDYAEAVKRTPNTSVRHSLHILMAQCHLRMKQTGRAVQSLKDAQVTRDDLQRLAREDKVLAEALASSSQLRAFAQSLERR